MALRAVLIVLGLGAVGLALLCTARYGPGTTPDSASYLSAARSLLAGNGYLYCDDRFYAQWPPLFPTLLALFGLTGVGPLAAARLLNSAAFGATVLLSGRLFVRSTTSKTFAIMGTLSVALAAPLLTVSIMTWSEPVFIVLALSFVLCLARFLQGPSLRWLLSAAALGALACLQRYVGVVLIAAGSLLIVAGASKVSLWRRFRYLVVFCAVSATPLALWLLRNKLAGHTVGGHSFRPVSFQQLAHSALVAAETLAPWFFSPRAPNAVKSVAVALIVTLAAALLLASRLRFHDRGAGRMTHLGTAAVVGVFYFGFLALSAAGLRWDPEPRLTAPLYVFVMLPVVAGAEASLRVLRAVTGGRQWPATAGILLCAAWLLYPLTETRQVLAHCRRHGAGGYSTPAWQQSPLMRWLRQHPLDGRIYSNVPDAVYILAGASAEITPHHYWTAADFAARLAEFPTPRKYVVWSHYRHWDFLYDLPELISRYRMEEIASFVDGKVYRLLGAANGPPVFGVYRFWSPRLSRHLYTLDKAERDRLVNDRTEAWTYEGPAFHVFVTEAARTRPVYRFRSNRLGSEFYTISDEERDKLAADHSGWSDEGVAFYAYPQPVRDDVSPVHRLWSDRLGYHFYTASEEELAGLRADPAHTWTYEGIAWYAHGP